MPSPEDPLRPPADALAAFEALDLPAFLAHPDTSTLAATAAALRPDGPDQLALRLDLDRLAYQRLHLELRRRDGGVLGLLTPLPPAASRS